MSSEALIQFVALTMLGEKVFPTNLAKMLIDGHVDLTQKDHRFPIGVLSDRNCKSCVRCNRTQAAIWAAGQGIDKSPI